jgi:LmbE family N-acetylglucosaminyl deacetylase
MKILMFVAHPDDEILFGYHDIYHNDVDIICFTNKNNKIRSVEFNECMNICNIKAHILDFPDSSTDTWNEHTNISIINNTIIPLLNTSYDLIVSHGKDGEYRNLQHIRVNSIVTTLSRTLNIPFMSFYERFDINDYKNNNFIEKRNTLLNIYKSQKDIVNVFSNFFYNKYKHKKLKIDKYRTYK